MKARRRYSDDFRATALAGLAANGGNVERTARALDIPAETLEQRAKGTRNPVPAQLSDQKRADLTEAMEQFAHKLMGVSLDAVKDLHQNKDEKSVLDVSKLRPHEQEQFIMIVGKMSGNPHIIYPPDTRVR